MSQYDFGNINTAVKTGTELGLDLSSWRDGLNSCHKGPNRPSYAVAGIQWIDDTLPTEWKIYRFDGTNDLLEGTIDPTTGILIIGAGNRSFQADGLASEVFNATAAAIVSQTLSSFSITPPAGSYAVFMTVGLEYAVKATAAASVASVQVVLNGTPLTPDVTARIRTPTGFIGRLFNNTVHTYKVAFNGTDVLTAEASVPFTDSLVVRRPRFTLLEVAP